jgi:hypothetical protein
MREGSWLALPEGAQGAVHLPGAGGQFAIICWDEVVCGDEGPTEE